MNVLIPHLYKWPFQKCSWWQKSQQQHTLKHWTKCSEGRAETEDAWTWRHIFSSFFHNSSLPSFLEDDVPFSVLVVGLKHFSMHCAVITEAHSLLNWSMSILQQWRYILLCYNINLHACEGVGGCCQPSQKCPSFQDILQTWHGKISVDTPTITLSKRTSVTNKESLSRRRIIMEIPI